VRGLVLFQVGEHARHLLGGHGAVDDAQLEELTGELLGGFWWAAIAEEKIRRR
jgi:hypothetical protein